ncbi:MAG: DUF2283 domain-containing protein [Nitrospirae bacterium]|nr:DUF2283 domain-containing protein [Nitrospirota bacterium]
MNIYYDDTADLLYLRLDTRKQDVINQRITDDVVIDIGQDDKIIGIEILNASVHVDINNLLPVNYNMPRYTVSPYKTL